MDISTISIGNIENDFTMDYNQLLFVRDAFQRELQSTLRYESSSLKSEPYYLLKPSGNEAGIVATLDLGGTNLNAHLFELKGNGIIERMRTINRSLRGNDSDCDYLSGQSTADKLFDFQAQTLAMLTDGFALNLIPLGYVFSFITSQTSLDNAILIRWAKEINTPGVEGRDVVGLLKDALVRNNLDKQIAPKLVMNDTIGTFMASAFSYPETSIGSVIGTGYNTCYLQPSAEGESGEGKIINLECGNFNKVPTTLYDDMLCRQSASPGNQKLEKMVSGRYLGELFRLMFLDVIIKDRSGTTTDYDQLLEPYSIDTRELSKIIDDDSKDCGTIKQWGMQRWALPLNSKECQTIKNLATMIAKRSASLIATTYAAIVNHVDPQGAQNHVIAINGSLYEKMPGYKEWLSEALNRLLTEALLNKVTIKFYKEGPALGAAVAVCMLE